MPPPPSNPLPLWARLANTPFIAAIWLYRFTLSPFVGRYCRFSPTCSQYGLEAYRTYGPWRATRLTLCRLARCQPLAKGGYDPIPLPRTPTPTPQPGSTGAEQSAGCKVPGARPR